MDMNCFGKSVAQVITNSVCFGQTDTLIRAIGKITNGNLNYRWDNGGATQSANESVVAVQFTPCTQ
ncbi:MAG: hypothetical protein A3F91_09320 [Flavobacteria bacterium RIFCSPLOWO2_12_FULL_35_11]|nr:MAG: hypothetical protein A3F91_09320 [Flavobacteria bacterium RIFCSPLOWO2_12_FULL_35_11]